MQNNGEYYRHWAEVELAERYLSHFIRQAWAKIDPSTYVHNWHIDEMCEHLEAVSVGDITRLIINIPPRHMKSLSVSVFWPAWDWVETPERRFLFASYAQNLSIRDAVKSRRLIQSPWYQDRWSDRFEMTSDQNTKIRYDNNKQGYRIATSVDGGLTGEGGDIIVVDDPHNVREVMSDTKRQSVIDWWDDAMSTRLNDPKTGAYVIIMQRVHEEDLVGHILAKNHGWDHLCLPARYEVDHPTPVISTIGRKDPRKKEGDLLFPGRFAEAEQTDIENRLSDYGVAGQQQQRPSPKGGGVIKDDWWQYYDNLLEVPWMRRVIYVDTAQEVGEHNDWTVFQCWGHVPGKGIYLLDQIRVKVEAPELRAVAKEFWAKHSKLYKSKVGASVMKIEKKSSGSSLIQDLQRLDKVNVAAIERPAGNSKAQRVNDYSPKIKNGFVWLPSGATDLTDGEWVSDFKREFRQFRLDMTHKHDDQVDPCMDAIQDMIVEGEGSVVMDLSR